MSASDVANRDYMCYWTAGQQLVHRVNPYDGPAVLQLEKAYGFVGNHAAFMRNPPWAFFLALPLGFMDERVGAMVWSLLIIAALMGSIRLLWIMHGRPPDRLHLVGYCFPPALACLLGGQIGAFLLFGVTLFLYLHKRRPYLAGVALFLCILKPHLFLPFGVALLAWVFGRKQYRILAGAATALGASLALGFFLDPHGWSRYTTMMKGEVLQDEFIPTISLMFRLAVNRHIASLQFLPALIACLWAFWYFRNNRDRWDWLDQGSLLLLVSVMVAPYAWFTDETVVLPAIFVGLYRASLNGRSLVPFGLVAAPAMIEVFFGVITNSGFYVWTAPAWLIWYVVATYPQKICDPPPPPGATTVSVNAWSKIP